jgi:SAM-dependent methyltransferase
MSSEERFGFEWNKYNKIDMSHEAQFLRWVSLLDIDKDFFKDKKVLDAGCGMGRNAYWALKYGARELVAFDNDERTIKSARNTLQDFPNARVEMLDMYKIPWENEFDIVMCIGVIHHLAYPEEAVKNLIRAAKPGAEVILWLYGKEGNEWFVPWLDILRIHCTSKIPPRLLYYFTYLFSVPLYVFLKLFSQKREYFKLIKNFSFDQIHSSIIFDQLLPKIARYYTNEEALDLVKNLHDVKIYHTNDISWTVIGTK